VAPLSKKGERLSSCSPPSISILHYLTSVNNSHMSYVILYIIFHLASGVPVCRCWFKLGWYIFSVFLASFNCRRCSVHLKHWSWTKIPFLTSLYNFCFTQGCKNKTHQSLFNALTFLRNHIIAYFISVFDNFQKVLQRVVIRFVINVDVLQNSLKCKVWSLSASRGAILDTFLWF